MLVNTSGCNRGFRSPLQNTCSRVIGTSEVRWNSVRAVQDQITRATARDISADPVDSCELAAKTAELPGGKANSLAGASQTTSHQEKSVDSVLGFHSFCSPTSDIISSTGEDDSEEIIDIGYEDFGWHPLFSGPQGTSGTLGLEDLDSRFKDVINTEAFDIITSNVASGEADEKTPSAPWLMKEALSVKAAVDEAVRGVGSSDAGLTKAPAFESGATGAGAHPSQQDEKAVPEDEVVSEVPRVVAELRAALGRGISASEAKEWVHELDRFVEELSTEDLVEVQDTINVDLNSSNPPSGLDDVENASKASVEASSCSNSGARISKGKPSGSGSQASSPREKDSGECWVEVHDRRSGGDDDAASVAGTSPGSDAGDRDAKDGAGTGRDEDTISHGKSTSESRRDHPVEEELGDAKVSAEEGKQVSESTVGSAESRRRDESEERRSRQGRSPSSTVGAAALKTGGGGLPRLPWSPPHSTTGIAAPGCRQGLRSLHETQGAVAASEESDSDARSPRRSRRVSTRSLFYGRREGASGGGIESRRAAAAAGKREEAVLDKAVLPKDFPNSGTRTGGPCTRQGSQTATAGRRLSEAFSTGTGNERATERCRRNASKFPDDVIAKVPCLAADLSATLGRHVGLEEVKDCVRSLDRSGEGLSRESLLDSCLELVAKRRRSPLRSPPKPKKDRVPMKRKQPHGPAERSGAGSGFAEGDTGIELRGPGRGVLGGGGERGGEISPGQRRRPAGDRHVAAGEISRGGALLCDADDVGGGSCGKGTGGDSSTSAAKREEGLAASSAACRMRTRSDGRCFGGPVRESPAETGSSALGNRVPARWSATIAAGKSSLEDANPSSKKRPRSPSKNDASSLRTVGSGNGRGAQEPRNGLGSPPLSEAVGAGARNAAAVVATGAVVTRSGRRVETAMKSGDGDLQGASLPGSPVLRSRLRLSPPRLTTSHGGGREALRVPDRDAALKVLYKRARLVRSILPEAVISKVPRLTVDLSAVLGYPVSTEEAKVRCRELDRCGEGLSQEELCAACASVVLHRDVVASLNQSLTSSPLPSKKKSAQTPAKRCQATKGTKKNSASSSNASGSNPGRERRGILPLETKMEAKMETVKEAKMETRGVDPSRDGNGVRDGGDRVGLEGLAMSIAGALGQAGTDCGAGEVEGGVGDQRGAGASSHKTTARGESEVEAILARGVVAHVGRAGGCVGGRRDAEDEGSRGDGLRGERVMDAIIHAKDGDTGRGLDISDGCVRPGGDVVNGGDEAQGRTGIGTRAGAESCDRAGGAEEAVGDDEFVLEVVELSMRGEQGGGWIEAANVSDDSKGGVEVPDVGDRLGAETEALKRKDAQVGGAMDVPLFDAQGGTSVLPNRDGCAGLQFSKGSGCCDARVSGAEAVESQSGQTRAPASTLPEKGNGNILDRQEGEREGGGRQRENAAAAGGGGGGGGACLERLPWQGSACGAVMGGIRQGESEKGVNGPSRDDGEERKLGEVEPAAGEAEARQNGPKQEIGGRCGDGTEAQGAAKAPKEDWVEGGADGGGRMNKASQHERGREKCLPDSIVAKLPQLASDLETFMGRAVGVEDAEARCRELDRCGEGLTQQELCDACVSLFLCNDKNNLGSGIQGLSGEGGTSSPGSPLEAEAEGRRNALRSPVPSLLPSDGDSLEREEETKCLEPQGLKGVVDRERSGEQACSSSGEDCDRRGGSSRIRDRGRDVEFETVLSGQSAREVSSPGLEGSRSDDAIRLVEEGSPIDVGSDAPLPRPAPPIQPGDVPDGAKTPDTNALSQESGLCKHACDRPRSGCDREKYSLHGDLVGETGHDIQNTTGQNRSSLREGCRKSERLQTPTNPSGPSPLPEVDVPGDVEDLSRAEGRGTWTRGSRFGPSGRRIDESKHEANCEVGGYAVFLTPPEDVVPFVVGKVLEKRPATWLEVEGSGKIEKSAVVVHWFSPKRAMVPERRQPLAVELLAGEESAGDQRSGGRALGEDGHNVEVGELTERVIGLPRESSFSVSATAAATAAAGAAGAEAGKLALTYSNGGWSADFLLDHSAGRFVRDIGVKDIAAAVTFFPKLLKSGALPTKVREVVSEAVAGAAAASAASAAAAKPTAITTTTATTTESRRVSDDSKDNGKIERCSGGHSSESSSGRA